MPLDTSRARDCLRGFDLRSLFIEELGWDRYSEQIDLPVGPQTHRLEGIAHKRDFAVFRCSGGPDGTIPPRSERLKIDRALAKLRFEHIIIYVDGAQTTQVWQWVKREPGRPAACREHTYWKPQTGEPLIQKLQHIAFSLQEEEELSLLAVAFRAGAAFDVERVTKRFYERFRVEHAAFLNFIKGIPDDEMQRWYASVMINRLMFNYFIQKKGFLNADYNYLNAKLSETQLGGCDRYYSTFLCPLFFEGFAKKQSERSPAVNKLLGQVPYLNGGLFQRHQLEELHGTRIQIADAAFERLFHFFEQYQWHLDERPNRRDDEINPDVLGYIFEKYINQKQMGAYYTKEDITGYIAKNTIIPFLFDAARKDCAVAFRPEGSVWSLLKEEPDRHIYGPMKKGAGLELPAEIAEGLDDVSRRGQWNKAAPEEYALPTEIWREVVARRRRHEDVRAKLAHGEIQSIDDFVTYNLDIRQFAQDVIDNCEGPELLRAFFHAIEHVSVLDPTCGSGAFLFAALNVLEPLYDACLDRMQGFLDDLERSGQPHRPEKFGDFRKILEHAAQHPNRKYFILKSIVVNNLYGVDIMDEAIEICKLRLFLKLVAQVERVDQIEPLPDIDFNIRAGNTLVGYATRHDVRRAGLLDFEGALERIEDKARDIDRLFEHFRRQQTELGGIVTAEDKQVLRTRLKELEDELNWYLAGEYGIKNPGYQQWLASHRPFHWFIDFHSVMSEGGFDVVIGNPPYVEYRLVRDAYELIQSQYRSLPVGNLYAFCMERSTKLLSASGRFSMIVPSALMGLDEAITLRSVLLGRFPSGFFSSYSIRPSKLFEGVDQRLCIYAGGPSATQAGLWSTRYHHWHAEERACLFPLLAYETAFDHPRLRRIPQLGSLAARCLMEKLEAHKGLTVACYFARDRNAFLLHYHRSPRYWIRAMDFEQYFRSPTRTRSVHHFRDLWFCDQTVGKIAGALLNSSLFFFWFISLGNGRNITGTDVESFPLGRPSAVLESQLPALFDQLMDDYRTNSFVRVRKDCEFQEFRPSLSKPIINGIDRVLGRHYGFTDEELDFVINYDIKYRMGPETEEAED